MLILIIPQVSKPHKSKLYLYLGRPTYQKNVMKYPFMVTPLTTQSANETLHMSM